MGSICTKPSIGSDEGESVSKDAKKSKRLSKLFSVASKKEHIVVDLGFGADGRARLISSPQENGVSTPLSSHVLRRQNGAPVEAVPTKVMHPKRTMVDAGQGRRKPSLKIISMPNGVQAEQLAAGWPAWLTSAAGEAIRGWVPRKAETFEKLDKIGQGTYSSVYKARDLETGKVVALKKVRFVHMDPESVRFMAREIHVLRRLDHPNVIKLEGIIASPSSSSLQLIFEYMEHDLAGLAASPDIKFTEAQVKCYMKQLLLGLEHCHSCRILHRDIKGSNLLIDDNGILRISDFGLATFFHPEQRQPLTSRVVTLWYRPPELLLGATEYGVSVDLWSSGCILAELFSGKPIMPGRTEVEQLHKIFKLCGSPSDEYWKKSKLPHATIFRPQQPYNRHVEETFKNFPSTALSLLNILLAIEPESRGTADSALRSEFFTSSPLPCDPSSLPRYKPSKEYDVKVREGESRKQRAAAKNRNGVSITRPPRESKKEMGHIATHKAQGCSGSALSEYSLEFEAMKREQSKPRSGSKNDNPSDNSISSNSSSTNSYLGPLLYPNALGSSFSGNEEFDQNGIHPTIEAVRRSHKRQSKSQRSCVLKNGTEVSNLSAFAATGNSDTYWDGNNQFLEDFSPIYDKTESSKRHGLTNNLLDKSISHKKADKSSPKEYLMGYSSKNKRHHSVPLLVHGGDIDEILRAHERRSQAVRKANLDKVKNKKVYTEQAQSQLLLHHSRMAI